LKGEIIVDAHQSGCSKNQRNVQKGGTGSGPRPIHYYEIRIEDHPNPNWFEGFSLTWLENGETVLSGPVADQAALHGLLNQLRNLNLTLIALKRLPSA
jgi:hypothetical protein